MGRPISNNFLGTVGSTTVNAVHQIQSTTWGAKDTSAVQGYLNKIVPVDSRLQLPKV